MSVPRRHWLFGAVLALAIVVRLLVMLAFRPIMWFGGDSASYLATGLRLTADPSRVGGYGFLLWLLRPAGSFVLVAAVQHAMGLASGLLVYVLACRYRLPPWAGTLAAVPALFDAYQLQLEQDLLPDAAFAFLVVLAMYLVLRVPGQRRPVAVAAAAFLLGISALVWPVGLILLLILVIAIVGWAVRGRLSWSLLSWRTQSAAGRPAGGPALAPAAGRLGGLLAVIVMLAAGAAPVLGYAAWFSSHEHQFTLTRSEGVFLWARTMSFADCTVIKPPAGELFLCPPPGARKASSLYVWDGDSPLLHRAGGRFGQQTNSRALDFALRAITAQPGGYAAAAGHDFLLSFYWDRPVHPSTGIVDRYSFADATTAWVPSAMRTPGGGTVSGDQAAYADHPSPTHAAAPFASWMVSYQKWVYLRGTLLGLIMLAWPVTALIRRFAPWPRPERRRGGGAGALPWAFALTILAVPPLTVDFDLRYLVPAIPAACLAAVLGFAPGQRTWTTSPAATATSEESPTGSSERRTTSLPSESTPTASPDST